MKHNNSLSRRGLLKAMGAGAVALSIGIPLTRSIVLGQQSADSPINHAVAMRIRDGQFIFDPVALRIEPGDSITWFQVADLHSTTAFHPTNNNHQLRIPEGAEPWDSGILGVGGNPLTFVHEFGDQQGVYDYFCIPHEFLGMVGRIVVGEALPGPATEQPLPDVALGVIPDIDTLTGLAGATYDGEAGLNAPLLDLFNDNPDAAVSSIELFIESFENGMQEDGSLWAALESSSRLAGFRSQLEEFAVLIRDNSTFTDALNKGDELKSTLELARQDLDAS